LANVSLVKDPRRALYVARREHRPCFLAVVLANNTQTSSLARMKQSGPAGFKWLAIALASCAHEDPPLIADPASTRETALPWNEQQKWERDGSAQGLNTAGRR